MTTEPSASINRERLDAERRAALDRFDDDLRMVQCSKVRATGTFQALRLQRLRAVCAYSDALNNAAGQPHDDRWSTLIHSVDIFLELVPPGLRRAPSRAALKRLRALVHDPTDDR